MTWALALLAITAVFFGCSAPQLPPGLPPPEYEQPKVMPWPPADAAAEAAPQELPLPDAGPPETGTGKGSAPDASVGDPASTR
jgi:hypothetical protein